MQSSNNILPVADKIEQLLLNPYSEESKQYAAAKDRAAAERAAISEVIYLQQQNKMMIDEREAVEYHEKQLQAEANQYASIYAFEQEQQQLADAARRQALVQATADDTTPTIEKMMDQLVKSVDSLKQIEKELAQNQQKREKVLTTWKDKKEKHAKESVKKLAKPFTLSDGTSFTLDEDSERAKRIQKRLTDIQLPSEMEEAALVPARDSFQRHIAIFAEFMQGLEEANPGFAKKARPAGFVRAITMQLNQINFKLIKKDAEDIDSELKSLADEDNKLYTKRTQTLVQVQQLTATVASYQDGNIMMINQFVSNELSISRIEDLVDDAEKTMKRSLG